MKTALQIIVTLALIDVTGFLLWAVSGQYPADSFFIGSITREVLRALFF